MSRSVAATAALLGLAACDGPREQAGEKIDNATGAVDGEDSIRSGPAETSGEAQDEALESANEAREAQADALEDAADVTRADAEREADRLEDAAERTRRR